MGGRVKLMNGTETSGGYDTSSVTFVSGLHNFEYILFALGFLVPAIILWKLSGSTCEECLRVSGLKGLCCDSESDKAGAEYEPALNEEGASSVEEEVALSPPRSQV